MKVKLRKKILYFSAGLTILVLLIANSEFLAHYFYIKKEKIDCDSFHSAQLYFSGQNLIAKPEFFNCCSDYCCKNIWFFIKKYDVKIEKFEPLTIFDARKLLLGCKVEGMWKIKGSYRRLTVYFYFCRSLELIPSWNKILPMNELFGRLIDGIEVVGDGNFYEVLGNFWYIRDNKNFVHCLEVVPIKPLQEYLIASEFSGKRKVVKTPKSPFLKRIYYYFCEYTAFFFDAITQVKNIINWE